MDVVVGTPGRIQDMLQRDALHLAQLKHVVRDEVDRMLDMGFADDVDEILRERYVPGLVLVRTPCPRFKGWSWSSLLIPSSKGSSGLIWFWSGSKKAPDVAFICRTFSGCSLWI